MKSVLSVILIFMVSAYTCGQSKNFIDLPYLETKAKVDTLVAPDRIYMNIFIAEKDTKGRVSVEVQENNMARALKTLGIDIDKQLKLADLSSNFRKYFLRGQDVQKSKSFTLEVYDALTAAKVIQALERIAISNVSIARTTYSKIESLQLLLKAKAVKKAKQQALAMANAIDQKVGNALFISDLNTFYDRGGAAQAIFSRKANYEADQAQPIDVEFQKIKVQTEVNVTFKLE